MKCPECGKQGLKSTIQVGNSSATLMRAYPFYDEDGNRHMHDPNTVSTEYACSNGHDWVGHSRRFCWCGWPGKTDPAARPPSAEINPD